MNTTIIPTSASPAAVDAHPYDGLGLLFYAVAACDRRVGVAELTAFRRMLAQHWMIEDAGVHGRSVEDVRRMEVAFEEALRASVPWAVAYARFEQEQLREPERYDGWTRSLILRTAVAIAKATAGVNASEVRVIGRLQKLLGRTAPLG
jgi:tellurite resistance protein